MVEPAVPLGEPAGGDPVCWLGRTCPDCGAMPSADSPGRCWRCERPYPRSAEQPPTPRPEEPPSWQDGREGSGDGGRGMRG